VADRLREVQATVISDAPPGLTCLRKELWIEPATGRVVRRSSAASRGFRDELIVIYRRSDTLGMWRPRDEERYNSGKVFVTPKPKYSQSALSGQHRRSGRVPKKLSAGSQAPTPVARVSGHGDGRPVLQATERLHALASVASSVSASA